MANVGFNPTFGENSLGVEAHLLDFEGDLYGQDMTVRFRDRIRDERKFKSVEELVRQIEKDVGYARSARLTNCIRKSDDARRSVVTAGGTRGR